MGCKKMWLKKLIKKLIKKLQRDQKTLIYDSNKGEWILYPFSLLVYDKPYVKYSKPHSRRIERR